MRIVDDDRHKEKKKKREKDKQKNVRTHKELSIHLHWNGVMSMGTGRVDEKVFTMNIQTHFAIM